MSRILTAIAVVLAVATAAGLAILWPGNTEARIGAGLAVDTERAEVVEVEETICPGFGQQRCQLATARLESGPDEGRRVQLQLGATGLDPDLDPGDDLKVAEAPEPPAGAPAVAGSGYALADFERGTPMVVLALSFSSADIGLGEALNLEVIAKEVIATLVGSIGLIAAVPVTT
ncbi:MAG: YibE/F family protein, partial [Thermoleophilaceae bacterium]